MPRPKYDVAKARRVLKDWMVQRIPKAPEDAPITVDAAIEHLKASGLTAHRATLYEHGLHSLIADGAKQQREDGGGRQVASERRAYDAQLAALREENRAIEARNRALLGEIATLVWNARRLGITEEELRKEVPKTNRTQSRAGRRS